MAVPACSVGLGDRRDHRGDGPRRLPFDVPHPRPETPADAEARVTELTHYQALAYLDSLSGVC